MGIKNLHEFLRHTCPDIYKEKHISYFAFQKIAVDTSIYVCKFKTTYGKRWLFAVLLFLSVLRQYDVHPVFLFDTAFPVEKNEEKQNRRMARQKNKERVVQLEKLWHTFRSEYVTKHSADTTSPEILLSDLPPPLLECVQKSEGTATSATTISLSAMDDMMERMLNTLLTVSTEDFQLVKELLTVMGIPYFPSKGEAEASCAFLARQGLVHGVLSEDTDVLTYQSPLFIHRFNLSTGMVQIIEYQEMLQRLEMTPLQFVDFCIMCGTDFNGNISKIGPDKSYHLLKRYGSIEGIKEHMKFLDITPLHHLRSREIFLQDSIDTTIPFVPYCSFPHREAFTAFWFQQNFSSSCHTLSKIWESCQPIQCIRFHPLSQEINLGHTPSGSK